MQEVSRGLPPSDVVDRAIGVLDENGLAEWSMRRLAADLGVQPSALYHHFAGKDELLAAVADEMLRRGRRPAEIVTWEPELRLVCVELRDAMRSHRDGAALIARVHAGSARRSSGDRMEAALQRGGADQRPGPGGRQQSGALRVAHDADDADGLRARPGIVLDGLRRAALGSIG